MFKEYISKNRPIKSGPINSERFFIDSEIPYTKPTGPLVFIVSNEANNGLDSPKPSA